MKEQQTPIDQITSAETLVEYGIAQGFLGSRTYIPLPPTDRFNHLLEPQSRMPHLIYRLNQGEPVHVEYKCGSDYAGMLAMSAWQDRGLHIHLAPLIWEEMLSGFGFVTGRFSVGQPFPFLEYYPAQKSVPSYILDNPWVQDQLGFWVSCAEPVRVAQPEAFKSATRSVVNPWYVLMENPQNRLSADVRAIITETLESAT